jgi:sugar phosphate permease
MNRTKNFYPWLVLFFSAAFLFYKYLLQISPSVMTADLMQNFHLNGFGLGNLAAAYFYTYLVTQLFVGPLLDKYGCRVLTALALLLCAVGAYGFSTSASLHSALLFRSLMGVGVAFATVSYMKVASVWFKPDQFALVSGLLATAAMAGSMTAQVPMQLLVTHTSWREALYFTSLLGVVLAVLFFVVVRDKKGKEKVSVRWKDMGVVLTKKHNWFLALYSGLAFSPLPVLGGLWGNPFLEEAYHVSGTTAASLSTFAFLGLALGGPLSAWVSNLVKNRYRVMQWSVWLSLVSLTLVIYLNVLPTVLVGGLLFLFGFGVGAFMLGFTVGKELNALFLAASVVALINTGDTLFGAFTEPFVGKLLDVFWDGKVVNGVHHFSVADYHLAFVVLPVYLLAASGFLRLLKKYC